MTTQNSISQGTQTMLRKRSRSARRWGAVCAAAMLPALAWGQNAVTDIRHSISDDGVTITLSTADTAPVASVFATEDPPRIVMDLPDTESDVSAAPVAVGVMGVQDYAAISSGGRTRLIVDLSRPANFEQSSEGNQVSLMIAGSGSAMAASDSSADDSGSRRVMASDQRIDNIDFRRGPDGGGRVIVNLSSAGANTTVDERGDRLLVDFYEIRLPPEMQRQLDVTDFATPVQFVTTEPRGDGARMELRMQGAYEYLTYQSGGDFIVEVSEPPAPEAEVEQELQFFEDKDYTGSRVTFNFQDIPVRSVLALIGDVADLNIVVSDDVDGNITLRLTNVPWDQAMDIVLDSKNLDMRRNGNVIWVAPVEVIAEREQQLLQAIQDRQQLEPLRTTLIDLSYAKAAEIQALILEGSQGSNQSADIGLLSDRGSVTIDERTNTLLVTDTQDRIDAIRDLVAELDRAVQQVQIESRIVIANDDFNKELGVRFGVTHSHFGNNNFGISGRTNGAVVANPIVETEEGFDIFPDNSNDRMNVNLPVSNPAGAIALSFISGEYILDLELSALESDGRGEVISAPRVVTANQAEAFIQQGVEIPFQEATSSGATNIEFKEAVLELRVTPLITPDDRVQLDLNVKQDTQGEVFVGANGAEVPAIDTRELGTTVLVNNGETIVLGGIFQDQRNYTEDKVPFLGDIPAVGNLFKRRSTQNQKRELLIFVTPTILDDRTAANR